MQNHTLLQCQHITAKIQSEKLEFKAWSQFLGKTNIYIEWMSKVGIIDS